jgi:hypothetical protein
VALRKHRSFIEGTDRVVVGEVINGADAAVLDVRIIATFYDGQNRLVGAQETVALLPQTQPRQTNPFRLVLSNAPASIERYELSLIWNDFSIVEFDRVSILSENVVEGEAGIEIAGELRNDHRQGIRDLRVVAAFYDAAGDVLDVYTGSVASSQLAPDETTTYMIRTQTPDLPYSSFLVQTQGTLER